MVTKLSSGRFGVPRQEVVTIQQPVQATPEQEQEAQEQARQQRANEQNQILNQEIQSRQGQLQAEQNALNSYLESDAPSEDKQQRRDAFERRRAVLQGQIAGLQQARQYATGDYSNESVIRYGLQRGRLEARTASQDERELKVKITSVPAQRLEPRIVQDIISERPAQRIVQSPAKEFAENLKTSIKTSAQELKTEGEKALLYIQRKAFGEEYVNEQIREKQLREEQSRKAPVLQSEINQFNETYGGKELSLEEYQKAESKRVELESRIKELEGIETELTGLETKRAEAKQGKISRLLNAELRTTDNPRFKSRFEGKSLFGLSQEILTIPKDIGIFITKGYEKGYNKLVSIPSVVKYTRVEEFTPAEAKNVFTFGAEAGFFITLPTLSTTALGVSGVGKTSNPRLTLPERTAGLAEITITGIIVAPKVIEYGKTLFQAQKIRLVKNVPSEDFPEINIKKVENIPDISKSGELQFIPKGVQRQLPTRSPAIRGGFGYTKAEQIKFGTNPPLASSQADFNAFGQPLEKEFFATPSYKGVAFTRASRLGIEQESASLSDLLHFNIAFKRTKPSIIIFPESTGFQLGLTSSELEAIIPAGAVIKETGTKAITFINFRAVPIKTAEVVSGGSSSALSGSLAGFSAGTTAGATTPYLNTGLLLPTTLKTTKTEKNLTASIPSVSSYSLRPTTTPRTSTNRSPSTSSFSLSSVSPPSVSPPSISPPSVSPPVVRPPRSPSINPPRTPPIFPPRRTQLGKSIGIRGKRQGLEGLEGYNVFLRRFGKFRPIGKNLPKSTAVQLGIREVRQGLGATFRLRRSGKRTSKPSQAYNIDFNEFTLPTPKSKLNEPLTFIQRRGRRLSSFGEVFEIQASRRKK